MCSASQDWRLFLGSILTVGGLLALWFYVNPDLAGLGVYLVKYIHKNETNTSPVNKVLPICKRNTTVDVYGDPGCPDNAHREHFCALFQAWTNAFVPNIFSLAVLMKVWIAQCHLNSPYMSTTVYFTLPHVILSVGFSRIFDVV